MNLTPSTAFPLLVILAWQLARASAGDQDYYGILGVSRASSAEEIKKAYKTRLIKMHPDRFPAAQKKEMEEKFKKVQEAFDVLGSPQLKAAYDRGGLAGLEQAKKDQQARDQWENQQRMHQEHFKQQQQNQDTLAQSKLELLNLENIAKFHRRINVWLLLFYKPGDADLGALVPQLERLRTDYDGILTVARVNCNDEEELCREFLVYGTPKLLAFSSFSGFDGKELDFSDELPAARRGDGLRLLGYVAGEAIALMEDFVVFLSENTLKDFEGRKGPKLVLFTAKSGTPPLWKALSKEFKNSVNFGIVRGEGAELARRFKVERFPAILGFRAGWLSNPAVFAGEFKIDAIKTFVRDTINGADEQRDELALVPEADLWQNRHCGANDKKFCLFLLADEPLGDALQQTLALLRRELAKEPFKLVLVSRDYFDPSLFAENQLQARTPSVVVVKGSLNRAEAFDVPDFDIAAIREHVNNILSSIVSLKRLQQSIENYVFVANKEL